MDHHLHLHITHDSDRAILDRLDHLLAQITQLGVRMMAVSDQVKQLAAAFDAETTAVSARIDALIAKLGNSVDPADVAALQAISDRLKVLGTDPNNPIPPM